MKHCCTCKELLDLSCFGNNRSRPDGLQPNCRNCKNKSEAKYRNSEKGQNYQKSYYKENKEVILNNVSKNYQKNREDKIAYGKAYYEENKEEILAQQAEHYQENREDILNRNKVYRRTDKGKETKRNQEGRRRARIKQNGYEHFSYEDLRMFWLGQNILDDRCYYCRKSFSGKPEHIDHYIPISQGGGHFKHNLRPSCAFCNISKSDKHPIQFMKENYHA